jgi:hypothetical protein
VLRLLRWWATLLDSRFRVPGTEIRFGLDPLLSLVPGLGDLASPVFTAILLIQAVRLRVPRIVLVRMVINAGLDAIIGLVPVAGNLGDVFWRANEWNLALLERHAEPGRPPSRGDIVFVAVVLSVLVLIGIATVAIAVIVLTLLVHAFQRAA